MQPGREDLKAVVVGGRVQGGGGKRLRCGAGVLCLLLLAAPLSAQDLDPRAYANVPVNATFLITGFSLSHGGVLTDPT
ncbi:MAG: hypothetical protein H6Q86_5004, partial [candidate division NC10 bacterium]|nr:hypothetical protein [candidate division NC10 bacterium]